MRENHLWNRAKTVQIKTTAEIVGNFNIGFDSKIPEETRKMLTQFVSWVEENFTVPVTLWVDFKYRHYLTNRKGKRVGYTFYWADWKNYPVFDSAEDIPIIELPVRMEHWTRDEILTSFIEAISWYYIWLMNDESTFDEDEVEAVLQMYLNSKNTGGGA